MPPALIRALADAARAHPLREKLLLAPSYRVGGEWLDWAARMTGGIANARPITPARLLLDLAEPELRRHSLRLMQEEETLALVGTLFENMRTAANRQDGTGYFTRLPASLSLVKTLASALGELDAAGLPALPKAAQTFASKEKADELANLYREYRKARSRAGAADHASLLDCALAVLRRREKEKQPILLVPESVRENAAHDTLALIDAWPEDRLRILPEDPGIADPAANECAAFATRTADSTANEARNILRALFRDAAPLDTAEVVVTDARTCIPAICEAAMETFGCPPEDIPVTFHSGVPAKYSRPARLLAAWTDWIANDLPPAGLANILRDGLLGDGWRRHAPDVRPEDLASRVLQLPVHGAPGEYRSALARKRRDSSDADANRDETAEQMRAAESWLLRRLDDILPLANGGQALDLADAPGVLRAAEKLLGIAGHASSKLDAYAASAFAALLARWIPHCGWPGFQPVAWLRDLADSLHVMGLPPQPGKMHVSDIHSGGFSGRERTFLVGLDDSRFPGGARQDPVLLDRERLRLSRDLPVSVKARERRDAALRRLLARLRGRVTLSHARHDAETDREQYPAALFTRFAEAEKNAPGVRDAAHAATLRPAAAGEVASGRDAILWTVLSQPKNALTPADFAPWFPRLARGADALAARRSADFTACDGHVPEAGADYRERPWAISPTDMETLATNPAEYFYRRVLKITLPDRFDPTPGKWLDGNERGNLLHDLFQDFVGGLLREDDAVTGESMERHKARLLEMLDDAVRRFRRRKPVRDRLAADRDRAEMTEACVIFLATEIGRNAEARPVRLEAALGGAKEDAPPWERTDAVELPLPDGEVLPLKGRIDRIDRLRDGGGLLIWDYKTGRSDKYSVADPFLQGRHLQPLLYSLMLDHVLRAQGVPEPVRSFSYFFPMPRDEGRTLTYAWPQLVPAGRELLTHLRRLLAGGIYPASPLPKDRQFSDYAPLFPATAPHAADPLLAPWRALRE